MKKSSKSIEMLVRTSPKKILTADMLTAALLSQQPDSPEVLVSDLRLRPFFSRYVGNISTGQTVINSRSFFEVGFSVFQKYHEKLQKQGKGTIGSDPVLGHF